MDAHVRDSVTYSLAIAAASLSTRSSRGLHPRVVIETPRLLRLTGAAPMSSMDLVARSPPMFTVYDFKSMSTWVTTPSTKAQK